MILRSQIASSQSENTPSPVCIGTTQSHKRSSSRRMFQYQENSIVQPKLPSGQEDIGADQTVLDMHTADGCMDQTHIYNDPAWKVIHLDSSLEGGSTDSTRQSTSDDLDSENNIQLGGTHYKYQEQHHIVFFKLCPKEKRWLNFGPGVVTMEGGMYASTLTVRMDKTFRILATWSVFGGMKVIRFLSTVVVLAIVPNNEGAQTVMSYGLKLATLEETKGLAILLSSSTRGLQMNMERLIPRCSATKRAKILDTMADCLMILKRRLGEKQESELSVQVETELAAMLSVGTKLTG